MGQVNLCVETINLSTISFPNRLYQVCFSSESTLILINIATPGQWP